MESTAKSKKKKVKKPKKLKPLKPSTETAVEGTVNASDEVQKNNDVIEATLNPTNPVPAPVLVSLKNEIPKIDEKLLYAKFKNESEWLKAVLKERKASLSSASAASMK